MAGATIQRPKGTNDVVPGDVHKWHYVESTLRKIAADFGFSEIRFPVFEHTELFVRGVGDTTDVVQKEMYTFEDKGGRSISLRPEGTASTVRAYLENSLYALPAPFKAYYMVPNFRYEKPQAGRLREHHQFGVEVFGAESAMADAEVISLADTFLKKLGVAGISLRINSIGCKECRPAYQQALKDYFGGHKDELCETCLSRLDKNPMRILDCKSPVCHSIAEGAPKTIDHLCPDCAAHFSELKGALDAFGIAWEVDPGIVRGLDYYTRTVFEFVTTLIGAQGTVCGGGRYDGLIQELGGKPTPGLGFGCGLERLLLVMESSNAPFPPAPAPDLFIAAADEAGTKAASVLSYALRQKDISVVTDLCGRSLKAQMKYADKTGARYCLVLGASEVESGQGTLKSMADGATQATGLAPDDVANLLK